MIWARPWARNWCVPRGRSSTWSSPWLALVFERRIWVSEVPPAVRLLGNTRTLQRAPCLFRAFLCGPRVHWSRCPAALRAFWLCDRGKQATCWLIAKKCFLSLRTAFAAAPLLLRGVGELWKLFHTSRSVIELRTARFWRPPCDEKEGPVGLVCN